MEVLLYVTLLVALLVMFVIYKRHMEQREYLEPGSATSEGAGLFSLKPNLWWFTDNEVNARRWFDFGARNSRRPNRGYLQVALDCVFATQGKDFNVNVLFGREEVAKKIQSCGGNVPKEVFVMPVALWRQWAIANLIAFCGGLAIAGDSTLCIGPSFGPHVMNVQEAVFGIYDEEPRVAPGSDTGPATWVGWGIRPRTSGWNTVANMWNQLASAGPTSWSAAEARRFNLGVWEAQKAKGTKLIQSIDGGRKVDGYQRTLEDLLMTSAVPADPKLIIPPGTVYIPMDGDKLARDYKYGWFIRMSSQQIMESDFVWANLARSAKSQAA